MDDNWHDTHSPVDNDNPEEGYESEEPDVIDDIAEMIADGFGRSVIDADRQLADAIYKRVVKEFGF